MIEVKKRDGRIVPFEGSKIEKSVLNACKAIDGELTEDTKLLALNITNSIRNLLDNKKEIYNVEEIDDLVEKKLMASNRKDIARVYVTFRDDRTRFRKNTTDKDILELITGRSEYWNNENSNKDATVVTTQRDYLAGITSTDIARRYLLPKEVCEAHDQGIIHQHDMDYMSQMALHNCCLINLDDCLKNGTIINGVKIEPQKRLLTAVTVATQIITAVASSQYGGCTISLTHLAPYVRKSYEYYIKKYRKRNLDNLEINNFAQEDLEEEIRSAVQTFNYQINSMSTTNGQAPFLSVMMWNNEDPEYKKETTLLIEEFLKQRIIGMKNEVGVYVTPAFPKLLYVLDEDNVYKDSEYFWLTELAAKCTAKRMVPDYISDKKMREYKINKFNSGDVYPCINKICA